MTDIFESATERPRLESLDDLISEDDLIALLGLRKQTLTAWRYGKDGKPSLPYLRLGKKIWFFKSQLVWWMNDWQEHVIDTYRIEHRARMEKVQWKKRQR